MRDYQAVYESFDVSDFERQVLSKPMAQGVNACFECCDRWADTSRVALNWIDKNGDCQITTFAELKDSSARFANLLSERGIGPGDIVAGMLPKTPELLSVILGTLRAGAAYQTLFTAFGPKSIETRISSQTGSNAVLVVTDPENRSKFEEIPECPPLLQIVRNTNHVDNFQEKISAQSTVFDPVRRSAHDSMVVLFTSGTTGNPKGVIYPNFQLLSTAAYMDFGLDLRDDDNFWCMADPGWSYGLFFTVLGPLMRGYTTTMFEGQITAESVVNIIKNQKITNLAGAPTVYRMLMAAERQTIEPIVGQLRVASSAGEALNPEVARWADKVLHCPLKDQYGQSELAMVLNNHHGLAHETRSGSAGLPMPGFKVNVLSDELEPTLPGEPGILAVNLKHSPLCNFTGYGFGAKAPIHGDWYLTGDTMKKDADGFFYFEGRSDDVITSSGYRIGPFDVESALMEHPAVSEVAVVGKPDPKRTEIVVAHVVLKQGFKLSDDLTIELQEHCRSRLAKHSFPRQIVYTDALPKTPSGKIQRFILRNT